MKRTICSIMLLLLAAAAPGFADTADFLQMLGPSTQAEVVGTPRDPGARAAEMQALQTRLAADRVEKALKQPVVLQLTQAERNQIDNVDRVEKKWLVGITRKLGATAASSVGAGGPVLGAERATRNGSVWTAAVRVPGATALRVRLTGVDLAGSQLYVYNLAGQAFGPYTGRGPLGDGVVYTNTVFGEQLLLQLYTAGDAPRAPRLTVAEVGIMGARFAIPRYGSKGVFGDGGFTAITAQASNLCSNNAECVVNAACQSSSVVGTVKDAIASILFQSGSSWYICTGGLIADTDTATVIPLFLTANHCISTTGEASSVETYFDYETTCSNPNCTQPYNNTGETVGSTLLAGSSNTDVTLLQLSSAPATPDGVAAYLGWTTTAVANTNNLALYRISHPKGSPQAYTEGVVDTTKGTCRTLPRGNFIYSRDTLGGTEGGSSGSPVVNSSSQIVGQLYGACGFNVNDPCDAASNATVDGAFAVSYSTLAPFLDPGTGGGCGAVGASCTSNSQCCSNSCKGKPGAQTCK